MFSIALGGDFPRRSGMLTREPFYMALPGGEDQISKGEACYENDQHERRNAIHTPYVQDVSFNIREV